MVGFLARYDSKTADPRSCKILNLSFIPLDSKCLYESGVTGPSSKPTDWASACFKTKQRKVWRGVTDGKKTVTRYDSAVIVFQNCRYIDTLSSVTNDRAKYYQLPGIKLSVQLKTETDSSPGSPPPPPNKRSHHQWTPSSPVHLFI